MIFEDDFSSSEDSSEHTSDSFSFPNDDDSSSEHSSTQGAYSFGYGSIDSQLVTGITSDEEIEETFALDKAKLRGRLNAIAEKKGKYLSMTAMELTAANQFGVDLELAAIEGVIEEESDYTVNDAYEISVPPDHTLRDINKKLLTGKI